MKKTWSWTYTISLMMVLLMAFSAKKGRAQADYYTGDEAEEQTEAFFRLGLNTTRALFYLYHSYQQVGYNVEPQLQFRVSPHARLLFSGGIAQRHDKAVMDNWRYHMSGRYAKVGVLLFDALAFNLTAAMYREYGKFIIHGSYFADQYIHVDDRSSAFGLEMMVDPGFLRIEFTDQVKLHFQAHTNLFGIFSNDDYPTLTVPGHAGGGDKFGFGFGLNMFLFFGS